MGNIGMIAQKINKKLDELEENYAHLGEPFKKIIEKIRPKSYADIVRFENELLSDLKRDLVEGAENYVAEMYVYKMLEKEKQLADLLGDSVYRALLKNIREGAEFEISSREWQHLVYSMVGNFGYREHGDEAYLIFFIGILASVISNVVKK